MGKAEVGQEGRQEKGGKRLPPEEKNEAPASRPQHAELEGKRHECTKGIKREESKSQENIVSMSVVLASAIPSFTVLREGRLTLTTVHCMSVGPGGWCFLLGSNDRRGDTDSTSLVNVIG